MNADGSGQVYLTVPGTEGAKFEPAWSLDGAKIAFGLRDAGNTDICVTSANGFGLKRLTSDPGTDRRPNWGQVERTTTGATDT